MRCRSRSRPAGRPIPARRSWRGSRTSSPGRAARVLRDQGTMSCYRAKTGEPVWVDQRVATGTYSASPVVADGKVYVTNEEGVTTVVKAGPKFEVLAENKLDGYTLSSIAVAGGRIYVRTESFLYSLAQK